MNSPRTPESISIICRKGLVKKKNSANTCWQLWHFSMAINPFMSPSTCVYVCQLGNVEGNVSIFPQFITQIMLNCAFLIDGKWQLSSCKANFSTYCHKNLNFKAAAAGLEHVGDAGETLWMTEIFDTRHVRHLSAAPSSSSSSTFTDPARTGAVTAKACKNLSLLLMSHICIWFVGLSVCLSVSLSACLPACLSVCACVWLCCNHLKLATMTCRWAGRQSGSRSCSSSWSGGCYWGQLLVVKCNNAWIYATRV